MNTAAAHDLLQQLAAARRSLDAGDAPRAAASAFALLRLAPDDTAARLLHAESLLALGRAEEALASLDALHLYASNSNAAKPDGEVPRAVGVPSFNLEALLLRARALAHLNRPAGVTAALYEALALDPLHRPAVLALASIHLRDGCAEFAVPPLRNLLAAAPEDVHVASLLAEALVAAHRLGPAVDLLDAIDRGPQAMRRCPAAEAPAALWVARLCRAAGRTVEALELFSHLAALLPQDAGLAVEAAQLAAELGDDPRVVSLLSAALQHAADHPAALRLLAEQHMRAGRFPAASRLWFRLSRLDPAAALPLAGLLVSALCSNRVAFSDRVHAEFTARVPDAADRRALVAPLWQLAMPGRLQNELLHNSGSHSIDALSVLLHEASDTLGRQLESRPNFADLHYHAAVCTEALGDEEPAIASLDRALKINPGYIAAAKRRLHLLFAKEDFAAAESLLDDLAARRPGSVELLEGRVTLAVFRSDIPGAAAQLAAAPLDRSEKSALANRVTTHLTNLNHAPAATQWRRTFTSDLGPDAPAPLHLAA
jgi:tetratricopeptide (TPR) repeat protein